MYQTSLVLGGGQSFFTSLVEHLESLPVPVLSVRQSCVLAQGLLLALVLGGLGQVGWVRELRLEPPYS